MKKLVITYEERICAHNLCQFSNKQVFFKSYFKYMKAYPQPTVEGQYDAFYVGIRPGIAI